MAIDSNFCHQTTSNGIRAIITMGDVSGKMLKKTAIPLLESCITEPNTTIEKINGREIGSINCCKSRCPSTAEATAAKSEEYNKYPPKN